MYTTAQRRDASRARNLDPQVDASFETEPCFAEIAPLLAHEAMNLVMGMRGLEALLAEAPLDRALGRLAALEERVQRLGEHLAEYAGADALQLVEIDPRRILADAVERIGFEDQAVAVAAPEHGPHRALGDTVFEPFRGRLGSESGLELPIARRVARKHGGDTMASHVGDRLVLTLALPPAPVAV